MPDEIEKRENQETEFLRKKSILKPSLFLNELHKITYEYKLRYVMEKTSRLATK